MPQNFFGKCKHFDNEKFFIAVGRTIGKKPKYFFLNGDRYKKISPL